MDPPTGLLAGSPRRPLTLGFFFFPSSQICLPAPLVTSHFCSLGSRLPIGEISAWSEIRGSSAGGRCPLPCPSLVTQPAPHRPQTAARKTFLPTSTISVPFPFNLRAFHSSQSLPGGPAHMYQSSPTSPWTFPPRVTLGLAINHRLPLAALPSCLPCECSLSRGLRKLP